MKLLYNAPQKRSPLVLAEIKSIIIQPPEKNNLLTIFSALFPDFRFLLAKNATLLTVELCFCPVFPLKFSLFSLFTP